jgi:peptidyl-dipeptidase Dcp
MQWHTLPGAPLQNPDAFEKPRSRRSISALATCRRATARATSLHIWANGYAAGYYAYLWSEMLDDDAYQWFEDHGGLTRANGDRFRRWCSRAATPKTCDES